MSDAQVKTVCVCVFVSKLDEMFAKKDAVFTCNEKAWS